MRLNKRIKIARIEMGKRQEDLAHDVGVSQGAISAMERGATSNLKLMQKCAEALGLTIKISSNENS